MGLIRFVIWTTLCVGLGIFLGTYELKGRTPWQYAQSMWKHEGPRLEKVREDAEGFVEGVKRKVTDAQPATAQPSERHAPEERQAIEQLISKRKG